MREVRGPRGPRYWLACKLAGWAGWLAGQELVRPVAYARRREVRVITHPCFAVTLTRPAARELGQRLVSITGDGTTDGGLTAGVKPKPSPFGGEDTGEWPVNRLPAAAEIGGGP